MDKQSNKYGLEPIIKEINKVDVESAVEAETNAIKELTIDGNYLYNAMKPVKAVIPSRKLQKLEYENLLGVISDREIAKRYSIASSSVREARKRRGIKTSNHPHTCKYNAVEYEGLLGKILDSQIAKMYNVTKQAVGENRRRLGIAPVGHFGYW